MSDMKLTVSEIKELMDRMAKDGLSGLRLKDGDFELSLKAPGAAKAAAAPAAGGAPAQDAAFEIEEPSEKVVKSPIVGTFYSAAAPDKPAFAPVGKTVEKGEVLFIIESMKLMNEVLSEVDGTVKRVLVENGEGVEYGQPIMVIE